MKKKFYFAKYAVTVDRKNKIYEVVHGDNFNPNTAKEMALFRVKERTNANHLSALLVDKLIMDEDEYRRSVQGTPDWLVITDDEK